MSSSSLKLASVPRTTIMQLIIICACLCRSINDPEVDANHFGRLMRGLHDPVHDVTFLYEGGMCPGKGAGVAQSQEERDGSTRDYQGRFMYRSDGAEFLEFADRVPNADAPQIHSLTQNLGGLATATAIPDLKRLDVSPPPPKSKSPAGSRPAHSTARPGSPHRIFFPWFFSASTDPKSRGYEFQGWEQIDGHRCLRVELDLFDYSGPKNHQRLRMWIDLDAVAIP